LPHLLKKLPFIWLIVLIVLAGCDATPPITLTPGAVPSPTVPPDSNLYPIAGQWHGGKVSHVAVYDRATGMTTLKHGNIDDGYTEQALFLPGMLPVAGDWDGDTLFSIGLYDQASGRFSLWNGNGVIPAMVIKFPGAATNALPLAGDWDGDGKFDVGLYEPGTSRYFLQTKTETLIFTFGKPYMLPLAGDWDGDGKWSIGQYDPANSTFSIRNRNSAGQPDQLEIIDRTGSGWRPVVGDWTGNGKTRFSLFDTGSQTFYVQDSITRTTTNVFQFGEPNPDFRPFVGDWNDDGKDSIGLYNVKTAQFFLRNENSTGKADSIFTFGVPGKTWLPVASDWNGDGLDTVGLWEAPDRFHLRNSNSNGGTDVETSCAYGVDSPVPLAGAWKGERRKPGLGLYWSSKASFLLCDEYRNPLAQSQFAFGQPGSNWLPIAGDWNGDKKWGVGLYEPDLSRFHLSDSINPAEEIYTFVFGKANSDMIPIAGDWMGVGRTDVGLYEPSTSKFYQRVPSPKSSQMRSFNLNPPTPRNPNLKYFGYYSGDGFDYTVQFSFIPEIAALGYTNIVHIHPQFEEYELLHFKTALDDLRKSRLRGVVNAQWIFVRQKKHEKAVQKLNWRDEFELYRPFLEDHKDVIEAFYFDEPIELGISASAFRDYSKALRDAFPDKRIIVVESISQILNGNLTPEYLTWATDIGIDLYYTDPTYRSTFWDYEQAFRQMSAEFKDKAIWIAADGYTRRGSTPRDLIDALDLYYSLARSTPRVVGMLIFLYSPGNPDFGMPMRSLIQPNQPEYTPALAALLRQVGQEILSNAN